MKKYYIVFLFLLGTASGFAQSRYFINLNGGLDFNSNKYYTPNNYTKFENGRTDYNVGLDLGFRFSDKYRFRLESRYVQYSFGQESSALKSERTVYNLDFSPRLDFRVWSNSKFELFLSPGLKLEYVITSDGETRYANGDYTRRTVYVNSDYRDKNSGIVGGAIFKYNYNKHLGFTLSPDYSLFAHKVFEKNDGSLQRFNVNAGVEWRF
jgi:hypothetical protein